MDNVAYQNRFHELRIILYSKNSFFATEARRFSCMNSPYGVYYKRIMKSVKGEIMPRSDYISDNLVNIRDRLKQNYAQTAGAAAAEKSTETTPAAALTPAPSQVAVAPLSTRTPLPARAGKVEELERVRRDLEERLLRDIATTTAALEQQRIRTQEQEKFLAFLKSNYAEFQQLVVSDNPDFGRQLERLRGEYFQAAGRIKAFEQPSFHAGHSGMMKDEPKRLGRLTYEALPLIIAIFIASLIIATALLVVFT